MHERDCNRGIFLALLTFVVDAEFSLNAEEDVELMLVAAMVSGADQLEVTVTAEVDGEDAGNYGAGAGGAGSASVAGMLPDELNFTELLVAAANKNANIAGQVSTMLL